MYSDHLLRIGKEPDDVTALQRLLERGRLLKAERDAEIAKLEVQVEREVVAA